MTMQMPEVLVLEERAFELPKFQLYGIKVGDIDDPKTCSGYKFSALGDPKKICVSTALWRGYVSSYLFRSDGAIYLKQLLYPSTEGVDSDEVDEQLIGDFWLDMRQSSEFYGRRGAGAFRRWPHLDRRASLADQDGYLHGSPPLMLGC